MALRVAVCLVLWLLLADAALAQYRTLPPPFQIDEVVRTLSSRYGERKPLKLSRALIAVGLGDAGKRLRPGSKAFNITTLIGTKGFAVGKRWGTRKSCDFLCGRSERATCHHVALILPNRPLADIGTPVAALPGRVNISNFRAIGASVAKSRRVPPPKWLTARPSPVFMPHSSGYDSRSSTPRSSGRLARWNEASRSATVAYRWAQGQKFHTMEGRKCVFRRAGPLVSMSCGDSIALLGTEHAPLIVSFGEYGSAAADVVAMFEHGGATHYLVRLGLKAQTAYGFLVRTAKGWRLRLRPRNYPLLC